MVILEPDGFSANNTIVERVTSNGTVLKRVTPNGGTGFSLEKLSELAAEYMSVLREAGIPIPKVQSVNISTESIDYILDDTGPNLVQAFPDAEELVSAQFVLPKVAEILLDARNAGASIDPHPKNFTIREDGEVHYVDFTPPLVHEYLTRRIAVTDPSDASILMANFAVFEPAYACFHFISDFLAIGPTYSSHMSELGQVFRELGVISDSDSIIKAMALRIRKIEDERLMRSLYLF